MRELHRRLTEKQSKQDDAEEAAPEVTRAAGAPEGAHDALSPVSVLITPEPVDRAATDENSGEVEEDPPPGAGLIEAQVEEILRNLAEMSSMVTES